ncbi:MAG TPA: type VII secretion protein EccE [Actinoplanes sp.]|nr:type VII secretion protein EccE [Actinoplanes sp.]
MTVRAVPRKGHLGPLSLIQIVVAEAALLAFAASFARTPLAVLLSAAGGGLLVLVFFARRQNRWWLEYQQVAREHRHRRAARADPRHGPVLAALRTIAPGLTVRDVSPAENPTGAPPAGPSGPGPENTVGVARDEAGWFSVVALDPAAAPLSLDVLVTALSGTGQPGLVLELVTHTVPAPSPDLPAATPSGASYRLLTDSVGAGPVPSFRESTISIRVDARALAEAVLDHTADPEEAARLVAGLARKVVTSLRRLGVTGRPLDADRLLALLARSCDVEPWALAEGPGVDEEWTHWRSARLIHRTYWLKTWPTSATEIGPLFAWAATAPAAQTSVALVLDPAPGDDIRVRAFIRLATRPDADLAALDRVLQQGVQRAGGELLALDGEHGPAAYTTAPTGGGAG